MDDTALVSLHARSQERTDARACLFLQDERILWKKNEIADYEATTFSILYNNSLFLVLFIAASFFIFKSFTPHINYLFSVGGAGGILALLSTSTK